MYEALSVPEINTLTSLLSPHINKYHFQTSISRLHSRFKNYVGTCPVPLPTRGLIVTNEIRTQCDRYLPIADVSALFYKLYSAALNYSPIFSSTPFHNAMSWADAFSTLPEQFQFSANPAQLLDALLTDRQLLIRFIFTSFLPDRFYGGFARYPEQQGFIRSWLEKRPGHTLCCLDAACGIGEDTYGLATLLSECGFSPPEVLIEGWTLEPLEVWAATHRRLPHDRSREEIFRKTTSKLFDHHFPAHIRFNCIDLRNIPAHSAMQSRFDLILCNGLLGGPIMHDKKPLEQTVSTLAQLLAPDGILLAADNFHGGWKQHCPQKYLRTVFEQCGLNSFEVGTGIGGLQP